jgi:hypothetical protein
MSDVLRVIVALLVAAAILWLLWRYGGGAGA